MDTLWILTEERPKASVIRQIIELYVRDFGGIVTQLEEALQIRPIFESGVFQFRYLVEGVRLRGIREIVIKTVSGSSSFVDFLVFRQEKQPEPTEANTPLMAIEETKTSDDESRNTGVYQRASKFVFVDAYYPNTKRYMLYNDVSGSTASKRPSGTNIFGTNMLLTLGVCIVGKDISDVFAPFTSIDALICFKASMRQPPRGNVPITITRHGDCIEISGRLSKPPMACNIEHDPNIGALSLIAKTLRCLDWNGRIVITRHGVSPQYVRAHSRNKFLYICSKLQVELDGIPMPKHTALPEHYWHYELRSEKVASILLHIVAERHGMRGIYQNHAGCERGYFFTKNHAALVLPKRDHQGRRLYIPDLILHDPRSRCILLIEGKKLSTLADGVRELALYGSIEQEYIHLHYSDCTVHPALSIFGGYRTDLPHPSVLLYLRSDGIVMIDPNAPQCIRDAFAEEGVDC